MRTPGFTQEITMSRWYHRRAADVARESAKPKRRTRRRRRRSTGPNARWHPRLVAPQLPPYIPSLDDRVVVRLRRGTVENFDEVHGHVVGCSVHPDRSLAYLSVQNCTRKVRLSWRGVEWKCEHDLFYYEVDLQPESEAAVA